jgi:hypothetical protein
MLALVTKKTLVVNTRSYRTINFSPSKNQTVKGRVTQTYNLFDGGGGGEILSI